MEQGVLGSRVTSYIALPQIRTAPVEQEPAQDGIALSVVIPCYNEVGAVAEVVTSLKSQLASIDPVEIILVDDGSTDGTSAVLHKIKADDPSIQVIEHISNRGYGAALKTGIRRAQGRFIAITDADGSYPNERIPDLFAQCQEADMVVGARTGEDVVYSKVRAFPKWFMRRFCIWVTQQPIPDINSGLRLFKRPSLLRVLNLLPDGFSFTTTVTIAMMVNRYVVAYEPINYHRRTGKSKIAPIRDTIRFFQLILRTGMYFAPTRIFLPVIALLWLSFASAFCYDVLAAGNLSDKTLLLLLFASNISLLALFADMVDKRLQ